MRLTAGIAVAVLVAGIWISLPSPTRAQQIVPYINEHGQLVYINANTPAARPKREARRNSATSHGALPRAVAERKFDPIITKVAKRDKLDPALVKAVINTESGWNPYAVSSKGAMGLMQLIPATAQRYGVGDPFDPTQNVEGGVAYLRTLLDRYHGNLTKSLAAYNAGERAVDASGGVPPYPETRNYVRKVTNTYFGSGSHHEALTPSPRSFPVRKEVEPDGQVIYTNE